MRTAPQTHRASQSPQDAQSDLSVAVVDHYDSYTYNLVHLIAQVTGALPRVHQHDRVELGELLRYDLVVLSPGPGSPTTPSDFSAGTRLLQETERPVLGVCLGMQGLVTTFGGRVGPVEPGHGRLARIEHDDAGLFAGLPQGFRAVRYHSLAAIDVPPELQVTATDAETGLVMGVRHRTRPLAGVQFHPESILTEHGTDLISNFLQTTRREAA